MKITDDHLQPGHLTFSHGPYTVTRPLVTQTVTQCKKCSSSTPLATTPVRSPSAAAPISTPYQPNGGADATENTQAPAGGAASAAATSSQPAYNGAGANVAGAGAGLAAVFGAVALLL